MLTRLTTDEAVEQLKAGALVLAPTETNYALMCRALDGEAVARLIEAKGRPPGKPLPVMVSGVKAFQRYGLETPMRALAERFWPGPLTVVVPAFPGLPGAVTADTNMVGLRVTGHPIAEAIVAAMGEPLVATSANRSGQPAASSPEACDAAGLAGVSGLVDGGATPGGRSTVVALSGGGLVVHREGPITTAMLETAWAERLR
ncbi:MAG: L-threonylcarbamoyladenylate synthase [Bradymonadia bacterium]